MPIEIKELLIRAFVGNSNDEDSSTEESAEDEESDQNARTTQDSVGIVANMLKQEKER